MLGFRRVAGGEINTQDIPSSQLDISAPWSRGIDSKVGAQERLTWTSKISTIGVANLAATYRLPGVDIGIVTRPSRVMERKQARGFVLIAVGVVERVVESGRERPPRGCLTARCRPPAIAGGIPKLGEFLNLNAAAAQLAAKEARRSISQYQGELYNVIPWRNSHPSCKSFLFNTGSGSKTRSSFILGSFL
eukprot:gene20787-27613_t